MNIDVAKKILKIALPIAGVGLSLITSWFDEKKLDDKIAEEVAKTLESQAKES